MHSLKQLFGLDGEMHSTAIDHLNQVDGDPPVAERTAAQCTFSGKAMNVQIKSTQLPITVFGSLF